jgi:inorganic pyrophosphatase
MSDILPQISDDAYYFTYLVNTIMCALYFIPILLKSACSFDNYFWDIIMLNAVTTGDNVPHNVNVIIEIPANSKPVKYEVDKETGAIFVDRFMTTSMRYPCNYGYIPNTLSEDGDPVDVLVVCPLPLITGAVVKVRPIGMLQMEDESGNDCKILAVPIDKLTPIYKDINEPADLPPLTLEGITHFFQHYKDLEKNNGKWVQIGSWEGKDAAHKEILDSIERLKKTK